MLNPASPLPLYHQLAERLRAEISAGTWAPGQRLPSEPELARQFGIGRPTVRQALEVLVRRGMAERRRGSGTFVSATSGRVDLFTLSGTVSSFRSGGLDLRTELLTAAKLSEIPSADLQNPFAGRTAVTFRRLGTLDQAPVLLEDLWLDPTTFPGLEKLTLDDASVSHVVRQHYNLEPIDGEQSFHVEAPPSPIARALQLAKDAPLLSIQRTLNFPNVKAAVFARLYCRTDRITFTQKLGGFPT